MSDAARRLHNPELSNLARRRVRLDAFFSAKKAFDDIVAQLLQEKVDDVEQNGFCIVEFNTNQLQTEKTDGLCKSLLRTLRIWS